MNVAYIYSLNLKIYSLKLFHPWAFNSISWPALVTKFNPWFSSVIWPIMDKCIWRIRHSLRPVIIVSKACEQKMTRFGFSGVFGLFFVIHSMPLQTKSPSEHAPGEWKISAWVSPNHIKVIYSSWYLERCFGDVPSKSKIAKVFGFKPQ